jgi:hypothetical protein
VTAVTAGAGRLRRGVVVAIALTTLAACSTDSLSSLSEPPRAPVVEPAPAQASLPPPAEPQPTVDNSPAARADRLASLPPAAAPTRAPPAARLVGLSRELLLDALGPAGFVRRDGPVQIWRYTIDECFLDVFLFREGNGFRVNHVEARAKGAEPMTVNICYQRLVAARRNGRPG